MGGGLDGDGKERDSRLVREKGDKEKEGKKGRRIGVVSGALARIEEEERMTVNLLIFKSR